MSSFPSQFYQMNLYVVHNNANNSSDLLVTTKLTIATSKRPGMEVDGHVWRYAKELQNYTPNKCLSPQSTALHDKSCRELLKTSIKVDNQLFLVQDVHFSDACEYVTTVNFQTSFY